MKGISLQTLAQSVRGELVRCDSEIEVYGAAPLDDAQSGFITLIDHERHLPKLSESQAIAVVTGRHFDDLQLPQIVVSNPHDAFSTICQLLRPCIVAESRYGIASSACVASSARVSERAIVDAHATIGESCEIGDEVHVHCNVSIMHGCRVGRGCQLYPGVVLYPGTILEDNVVIHAGAVLGAHGFGYRMENGCHRPTSQLGWVHIERDVEIGANTTIDRGTYGATRIGRGSKLDNLVMIGHNCHIGQHNLICAQVGIAGSSSTGDYVVLAGQAGVRDHVHIGNRAVVGAQSGIASDVKDEEILLGSPAMPRREQATLYALTNRLPNMRKTIKRLESDVAALMAESPQAQRPREAA